MATRTSPVSGDLDYVKSHSHPWVSQSLITQQGAVSKGPLTVPAQPQREPSALVHAGGCSLERDTVLDEARSSSPVGYRISGKG